MCEVFQHLLFFFMLLNAVKSHKMNFKAQEGVMTHSLKNTTIGYRG